MTIDFKELDTQIAFAAMAMPNDELAALVIAWFDAHKAFVTEPTASTRLAAVQSSSDLNLGFIEYFKQKYTDDLMNVEIPPDESEA